MMTQIKLSDGVGDGVGDGDGDGVGKMRVQRKMRGEHFCIMRNHTKHVM